MQYLNESLVGPISVALGTVTAVTALGATYYIMTAEPSDYKLELANQSIEISEGIRGSKFRPDGSFPTQPFEDVATLHDAFLRGLRLSENSPCLGTRSGPNLEYEWISYREVYDRAHAFGSWMSLQGLPTGNDTIIGIYSQNRVEWVVAEQACTMYSRVPTALYDTLGTEACKFIIHRTCMPVLVCDTGVKVNKVLDYAEELSDLKYIVVMETIDGIDMNKANKLDIKIVQFAKAVAEGKGDLKAMVIPKPSDLALIAFTSGTTGNPKGVMLTHANAVSNVTGVVFNINRAKKLGSNDVHMSYLPLAHNYERFLEVMMFMYGARVGFFRGDVKLLSEDLQALHPTILITVPRLLNKLYDKVMAGVRASAVKSALFRLALSAKEKQIKKSIFRRDTFWDRLVFRKIQALFGGHIEVMITGSAPLEQNVLTFARCAFGCNVLEGYGQTEICAGICFTLPGEYQAGHVGPPMISCHVKLVDVPELGYYAVDGHGEVCANGPSVFIGYYKDPERTAETVDKDGWLHTGDIGQWQPNGTMKIIDRKKNIFKLAQGEYVIPEKVEIVFMRSPLVAQAFVEGDSHQRYVACLVVPDEEVLMPWAKKKGIPGDFKDLCQHETVKQAILESLEEVGRAAGLNGFELPKDIIVHSELFSVDNNLLTPTFKNKRPELRKKFKVALSELYKRSES